MLSFQGWRVGISHSPVLKGRAGERPAPFTKPLIRPSAIFSPLRGAKGDEGRGRREWKRSAGEGLNLKYEAPRARTYRGPSSLRAACCCIESSSLISGASVGISPRRWEISSALRAQAQFSRRMCSRAMWK